MAKGAWLCTLGVVVALSLPRDARAQDAQVMRAAMYLCGTDNVEAVDEELLSQLEALWGRSLRVNGPLEGREARLLLTPFQVASLREARARTGDIRSFEELSTVDGFGHEAVQALRPFLSLDPPALPGQGEGGAAGGRRRLPRTTLLLRNDLRRTGIKGKSWGDTWRMGFCLRQGEGTCHAEVSLGRNRLLLGHYHMRFGQGINFQTGFAVSSVTTPESFFFRSTGFSPAWSYAGEGLPFGAVYAYETVRADASAFLSCDGTAGLHGAFRTRGAEFGLTACRWQDGRLRCSADIRGQWKAFRLAAELAERGKDWAGRLSVGTSLPGGWDIAFMGSLVPARFSGKKNGAYTLGVGGDFRGQRRRNLSDGAGFPGSVPIHQLALTVEASLLPIPVKAPGRREVRVYGTWQWQLASPLSLQLRMTHRHRNYEASRTDLRLDGVASWPRFGAVLRTQWVRCAGDGLLCYAECGCKGRWMTAHLRVTGYATASWNNRVYCYERDAPGNFYIPAYYGRGGGVSLMLSLTGRLSSLRARLYLRGEGWWKKAQAGVKPGLRVQCVLDV